MTRTILCYGDSNTWGFDPLSGDRLARHMRWSGVLQQALGEGWTVIEEGLNGRTTVWDDPIEGYKNGKQYLAPCLQSHRPLDLVIIMQGIRQSLLVATKAIGIDKMKHPDLFALDFKIMRRCSD